MNDDMRDEVPVPHFEQDLWRSLAQVHAEQRRDRSVRGPVPGPPEVVALKARLRARRTFMAGVGAIAAAAAVLAAVVVTNDGDNPDAETADNSTTIPTSPEMSLAAQITAATQEASASSIIHTTTDNLYAADDGTMIGDDESWMDEQSGARRDLGYDSEGQPSFDTGRAEPPAVDDEGPPPIPPGTPPFDPSLPQEQLRQVDYCFAEYAEFSQTAIPGHHEADRIGEWLEEGMLVEDGTEIVDGRELIRLVQVPVELQPPSGSGSESWSSTEAEEMVPVSPTTTAVAGGGETTTPPTTDPPETVPAPTTTTPPPTVTTPTNRLAGATTTVPAEDPPETTTPLDPDTFEYVEHIYLVDAETLRPVRIIGYPGEAPDYSDAMYIATIEYLPRTPENMALLSAPIPDGFELVAELRGDGQRYEQCGW